MRETIAIRASWAQRAARLPESYGTVGRRIVASIKP
jgi:hypothetical protein